MRAAAKMMMVQNARNDDNEMRRGNYRNEGNEMRYRMEEYPEMRRRRDSRGRYMEDDNDIEMRYRYEGDNGAEMRRRGGYRNEGNEMRRGDYRTENYRTENNYRHEDMPESRFRDRRGREHYDDGRFAPMRNMMDDDEDEPRGTYPRIPPYMPGYERRMIGFGDDTMMMGESREHGHMQRGMAEGEPMDLDQMSAEQWARSMEKEDGSKGPKWTKEQVKPYMAQVGYNGPEYKFWAVMNAMYSDYCKIAKKYGHDRPEYYADLAKAWLEDKDANPEKAGLYYKYIVKH